MPKGHLSTGLWLAWVVLLLVVCGAYANSLQDGFHFDDYHTVVDNPAIRSLDVRRFFADTTAFSVLPANRTYRPLVSLSLAVDYALGGGYKPLWFHLSTLAWFLLLVYLLGRWSELVFGAIAPGPKCAWLGLLVAAWFGLHPAMAETVDYVIQRGDLYCTLGCVAALYVYARWAGLRRYGLYLVPLVAAMLSKPPAAVFPGLLLLYIALIERPGWKSFRNGHVAMRLLPSIAAVALLLWLQAAMTPRTFMPSTLSAAAYRLTQPYVWMRYFSTLWLPMHLSVDTDLMAFTQVNVEAFMGFCFVAALLAVATGCVRRRATAPIAFGLLWFVVTQLPTSLYALSEVENDHRMFFSFPGLMIAGVWAMWLGWQRVATVEPMRRLRPVLISVVLLCLCGYAYGVHVRNTVWHDDESLWHDDVLKSPHNGRGLMNYGLALMGRGDYAAAREDFNEALRYTPNYATLEINLGIVNGAMGDQGDAARAQEAERHFRRAVALAPSDELGYAYYGRWLSMHGRNEEAMATLEDAVRLNSDRTFSHDELILACERAGDATEARRQGAAALKIAPHDATALAAVKGSFSVTQTSAATWINRSLLAYQQAQYQEAIDDARYALAIDPRYAEAWNNVAAGEASLHHWDAAIAAARRAVTLKPNLQLAKNNLAWAVAQKRAAER